MHSILLPCPAEPHTLYNKAQRQCSQPCICFITAVCPCPLTWTENSTDRVLEGEPQGVTIKRWRTSGGWSCYGLGTIWNHSPFLTLVYSLSLKWRALFSVPCSCDYAMPYVRLKSIRGWNLQKCKLKEPLFSCHPSTNQPQPCLASEIRCLWVHSGWYGYKQSPFSL